MLIVLGLIAIALGLSTVNYWQKSTTARTRADSLAFSDSVLRARNAALDTQMAAASRQKEAELNRLRSTYDQMVNDMQAEIAQGQIQITRLADRLSMSMVDRILFPSGEADITPAGYRVLRRGGMY